MDSKKLKKILKEAYNVGVLKSGGDVKTTYINNRMTFEEWYESKVKNNDLLHSVSVSDFDYPYITPPDDDNCEHPMNKLMFWNDGTVECKKCNMRSVKF